LTNTVGALREQYADSILLGAPEADKEFEAYVLPDVAVGAKALAEQFVLMARAETLEKPGEYRTAEDLAERLVREQVSQAPAWSSASR
jgi:hypothetical protein